MPSIRIQSLLTLLYFICVLIITRQVPLSGFSLIGNTALLGIFILYPFALQRLGDSEFLFAAAILVWSAALFCWSVLICGNETGPAVRFMIITSTILLAYFIVLSRQIVQVLLVLVLIQCIFLIVSEILLSLRFNETSYLPLRYYVVVRGWGDVYTYDGVFYRIAVKGNALIPFFFFLTFVRELQLKRVVLIRGILLAGLVFAGNFAYLLATAVFLTIHFLFGKPDIKRLTGRLIVILALLPIALIPVSGYFHSVIERKDDSLGTRWDQARVLFDDLSEDHVSLLFGKGLGNSVDIKTKYRDYSGQVYFELQSLYLMNQLGLVNFLLFLAMNIYLTIRCIRSPELLLVYGCYVIYAVTNPYIFDTNHVVVIFTLVACYRHFQEKETDTQETRFDLTKPLTHG